jgi:hypothetical protein
MSATNAPVSHFPIKYNTRSSHQRYAANSAPPHNMCGAFSLPMVYALNGSGFESGGGQ